MEEVREAGEQREATGAPALRGIVRSEDLLVTPGHPFYVPERGFVSVEELQPGDGLVSLATQTRLWVKAIVLEAPQGTTHNLTVEAGHTFFVGGLGTWVHNVGPCKTCPGGTCGVGNPAPTSVDTAAQQLSRPQPQTPDWKTGVGYGVNDPPVRLAGSWSKQDLYNGLMGRSPKGLGSPHLHHADQMPGSGIHEVLPEHHLGNKALHPSGNTSQGVTSQMRDAERQLHWWYRAREQGAELFYPELVYGK